MAQTWADADGSPNALATRPVKLVLAERPALADDVELAGRFDGGAFAQPQWLIVRNGRYLQVPELLYRVAELADGTHTAEEIAATLSDRSQWVITAVQVQRIIATKLIPMGVVALDGTALPNHRGPAAGLLQLRFKRKVLGPAALEPVTRVLRFLYLPLVAVPMVLLIALAHAWLYLDHGLAASLRDLAYTPGALALVLALLIISGIVHEFGHASALHFGGGRARSIGVGLYLVYPAFYTDITDSYRLGRWARVRTDVGGFYFQLMFALAIFGLYFATAQEWLLVAVMTIDLLLLRQLIPLVRFDGYWAITDLLGIPDILSRMTRAIAQRLGRVPSRQAALKPWAAIVFTVYAAITAPLILLLLGLLVVRAPLIFSSLWSAFLYAEERLGHALATGQPGPAVVTGVQAFLAIVQAVGLLLILFIAFRAPVRGIWRWTRGRIRRRLISASAVAIALGIVVAYWANTLTATASSTPSGLATYTVAQRYHTLEPVTYPQSPPVGGPHSPIWQNCGFYATPIGNEHAVHSMEHGAVWITYRPDLKASEVAALRVIAARQSYVLVSPYPGLPSPIVASAWGRQLKLSSSSDLRLDQFLRSFRLGKQAPERGGRCVGGIGVPQVR